MADGDRLADPCADCGPRHHPGQTRLPPGQPVNGYDVFIAGEHTGEPLPRGERGVLAIRLSLPPGCLATVWQNDALFAEQYCSQFPDKLLYSTFDYAEQDEEGNYFILGRMDDVINVAGHRIDTREIEEARAAVARDIEKTTVSELDAIARPAFLSVVPQLPKIRSGKIVRRAILAIAEGRDPGDLRSLEDPAALDHIREAHALAT